VRLRNDASTVLNSGPARASFQFGGTMRKAVIGILAAVALGACGETKPLGPNDRKSPESESAPPSASTTDGDAATSDSSIAGAGGTATMSDASIVEAGGTATVSDGSMGGAGGTATTSDGLIAAAGANVPLSSTATETPSDCVMGGALEEIDICSYGLPDLSADPDLLVTELSLIYYPGSIPPQQILQTIDATVPCSVGWTVDDPTAPTTIELCTETCELIQADELARLEFRIGCYTE